MATTTDDYYELLGLSRGADDAAVRRGYKRAALRWHPDKNPEDRERAEVMFKKIAKAYKVLSDPRQRNSYDQALAAKQAPPAQWAPPAQRQQGIHRGVGGGAEPLGSGTRGHHAGAFAGNASEGIEEAYSLFEDFFGHDPFKNFDKLFAEAAAGGDLEGLFDQPPFSKAGGLKAAHRADPGPAGGTATSSRIMTTMGGITTTTTSFNRNQATFSEKRCTQPVRKTLNAAAPAISYPARFRCVGRHGVAFRRTMTLHDRVEGIPGPHYQDIVLFHERRGDWLRNSIGWVPISINGEVLFEVVAASQVFTVRCLSSQGVAYRRSMNMQDRLEQVRGPSPGDVVVVEERWGNWVRATSGWLPLRIGEQQVFEFVEGRAGPRVQSSPGPQPSRDCTSTEFLGLPSLGRLSFMLARSGFTLATYAPRLSISLAVTCLVGGYTFVMIGRVWLRTCWRTISGPFF